uniref:Uncharacterized protein n=1 Tax=Solanum tuberosum TaxID=4113 RepID=M1E0K6_SOLTU
MEVVLGPTFKLYLIILLLRLSRERNIERRLILEVYLGLVKIDLKWEANDLKYLYSSLPNLSCLHDAKAGPRDLPRSVVETMSRGDGRGLGAIALIQGLTSHETKGTSRTPSRIVVKTTGREP